MLAYLLNMRRDRFALSADTAFAEVMRACAEPRAGQRGTWIDRDMRDAYGELHRRGHAHSIEVWLDDRLVGGLYGVAVNGVFFGESMFSRVRDTSKIALVALVHALREQRIDVIDCQIESEHLNSLGARSIPRVDFEKRLAHTRSGSGERWCVPRRSSELLHRAG